MDDSKLAAILALLSPEEQKKMKEMLSIAEPGKLVVPIQANKNKGKGKGKKPAPKVNKIEQPENTYTEEDNKPKPAREKKQPKAYSSLSNIPKGNGARAATTNITLGKRPNIFVTSPEFNSAKADAEIDRLLWGKKKPSERDRETRIESTCKICGVNEEVSILLAGRDEETKQIEHTCKKCSGNRKI